MSMTDYFLPESHRGCSLDSFDWKDVKKAKPIVEASLVGGKGLFLIGDPGIGKTHLLSSIFRYYMEEGCLFGKDVVFVQWSDLVTEMVSVMEYGKIPESVMDRITNVKILLVDDIRPGWGRVWNDVFKRLVEKAYEKGTRLFLTTNAESVDDLVGRLNIEDYWLSRLNSLCTFIKLKGEDRRQ